MQRSRAALLIALLVPTIAFSQIKAEEGSFMGTFKWSALDGKPAPQLAPDGKTMILASTMQLDYPGMRFKLSFTVKSSPTDSAVTASHAGRFRYTRDSLFFVNDGQETRPPVRFKYAWLTRDRVALTDIQGHVWVYVK